jgi:hypothetical protein
MNSYLKNHGSSTTLYGVGIITTTGEGCFVKYNDREIWIDNHHEIAKGRDWIRIPTWLAKRKGFL